MSDSRTAASSTAKLTSESVEHGVDDAAAVVARAHAHVPMCIQEQNCLMPPLQAKDVWGNAWWTVLHVFAAHCDLSTPEAKEDARAFLLSPEKRLPCGICRQNFASHVKQLPLTDDYFVSNRALHAWTVAVHNVVNRMNGKPEMPAEVAWTQIFEPHPSKYFSRNEKDAPASQRQSPLRPSSKATPPSNPAAAATIATTPGASGSAQSQAGAQQALIDNGGSGASVGSQMAKYKGTLMVIGLVCVVGGVGFFLWSRNRSKSKGGVDSGRRTVMTGSGTTSVNNNSSIRSASGGVAATLP